MTNDRLQDLLNLILFTHEITNETDNAHLEICEVFDELERKNNTLLKLWETNHLLSCLAEECGEVMELMYLEPSNKEKIEHELNDIFAVAYILHDKDIVCANLEPAEVTPINKSVHPIFECVKDIHYYTHKAIRFGLLDEKPNSSKRNTDELQQLLSRLVSLVSTDKAYSLWGNHDKKISKVLKHLDYAKEKIDFVNISCYNTIY